MKKLLFLLLTVFTFIGVINAEEYYFNFRTEKSYAPMTENIMYKEGFLFIDSGFIDTNHYDDIKTYIAYYGPDKTLIKSKTIDGIEIMNIATDDEYLYAIGKNNDGGNYVIFKIDENFDVVKSLPLNELYEPVIMQYISSVYSLARGINYLTVENNTIKILTYYQPRTDTIYPFGVITMSTDLTNINIKRISESNDFQQFKLSLEKLYSQIDEQGETYLYTEPILLEDDILLASSKMEGICFDANIIDEKFEPKLLKKDDCVRVAYLTLYDDNGTKIWDKAYPTYNNIGNLRITPKYIIAVAHQVDMNDEIESSDVLILDHDGNVLQTIDIENAVTQLEANDDALIFTSLDPIVCERAFPFDQKECMNRNKHEVYLLEYKIETKVNKGKGTVEAIKSSKPGEPVTFVVTPAEGYVLGEVRVTDANGKTIVFKQNVFTMPSADVMIEAEFLPITPETKDLAIALIIMLSIVTLVITIVEGKKLKFLGV